MFLNKISSNVILDFYKQSLENLVSIQYTKKNA